MTRKQCIKILQNKIIHTGFAILKEKQALQFAIKKLHKVDTVIKKTGEGRIKYTCPECGNTFTEKLENHFHVDQPYCSYDGFAMMRDIRYKKSKGKRTGYTDWIDKTNKKMEATITEREI